MYTFDDTSHNLALAACYVRGVRPDLDEGGDDAATVVRALQEGVRLHRFKRTALLPRVKRVLGVLRGLGPTELLDVGSGRGAFLWPLLDAMPDLPVTCIDRLEHRVEDIQSVLGLAERQHVQARRD